ncbi:flagellar hook capping FlgD N-terminal domain-containing protein [Paenibacillus sp. y28]|uniref:flagellar hook capping FlgD N-terminal domain-containing protein n=1 Tax=Paenibacillus sp. y28 TaxID=3129110 RepID=UPI0030173FDC
MSTSSSPLSSPTTGLFHGTYYDKTKPYSNSNDTMGKDQFLKILMVQLQNQDPTQPLQDKEFIAQMAQFTSVEQLSNMASEMKSLRQSLGMASDLIGKSIDWELKDDDGNITAETGIVESIVYKEGIQYAVAEGVEVPLDQIKKISAAEESE